jgi:hypothetical protein
MYPSQVSYILIRKYYPTAIVIELVLPVIYELS